VTRVATLESRIDALYAARLEEFVAARAALAAELKGADARSIRQLKKPTSVPWAVNQVYWHARGAFEHLQRSGTELRRAQVAALEGQSANVHAAVDVHRKAIAAAVERAMQLAQAAGIHPSRDGLTRTFEALSLASRLPEPPGRLTSPLQPGGFEMLAGVEPVRRGTPEKRGSPEKDVPPGTGAARGELKARPPAVQRFGPAGPDAEQRAAVERTRQLALAAATRRRNAAIAKLERAVHRAKAKATLARRAWDRATDELAAAERRLIAMRDSRQDLEPSSA
jgi:hypothetical protein